MSAVGIWASTTVLIIYDQLHQQLPGCSSKPEYFFGFPVNCDAVLSSQYSTIDGIPLEFFAIIFFMVNLGLVLLLSFRGLTLDKIYPTVRNILRWWRYLGVIIVSILIYIEIFKVGAICLYCTTMHISIIADFGILTWFYYKKLIPLPPKKLKTNKIGSYKNIRK